MGEAAKKLETPDGEWLSESAIAKRLQLHRQTVATRIEDLGYEPDEERSNSKLKVYWFDSEMEFAIKAAKDTLTAAKIRDTRATYQLKELKLAKERGELVPMAEATEVVQRIVSTIYQEFTARQPKRIGNALAKANTAIKVKAVLKKDTDRIMQSLRENFEAFIDQK